MRKNNPLPKKEIESEVEKPKVQPKNLKALPQGKPIASDAARRRVDKLSEMLVKSLEIIQVEVVTRNIAAGSLAKRLGWAEGTKLPNTVVELYYKNDDLGDPIINDFHVAALNLATPEQVAEMESIALKVNEVLTQYLKTKDIELIDFKLEFGLHKGMVLLGDEISPDTCRFWDSKTGEKLDKDRFRRDLGNIEDAYKEVLHRLTGEVIC